MTEFDDAFWDGLARAGGRLTFLRRRENRPPVLEPGGDADVLVEDMAAAAAYLKQQGFIERPVGNSDQRLMCWWPRGDLRPMYVDLYRRVSWAGGWYWSGTPDQGWMRLAHGLIAKGDWRHVYGQFGDDDLAAHHAVGRGRLFNLGVGRGFTPALWLLCWRAGLRWSPRRWLTCKTRAWRLRVAKLWRQQGVEVGFSGVDGAGKSSTIESLARGYAFPSRVIYMGAKPGTWAGKCLERLGYRGPGRGMVNAADMVVRRLQGKLWARRGRVVLYDRDPACRTRRSGSRLKNAIYAPMRAIIETPVDVSIFLDGDVEAFWRRKGEHDPEILAKLRDDVEHGYTGRPPVRIDSAALKAEDVAARAGAEVHRRFFGRLAAGA